MKLLIHLLTILSLVASSTSVLAQRPSRLSNSNKIEKKDLGMILGDKNLWKMSISDFYQLYRGYKFKWQSTAKQGLRSEGTMSHLFTQKSGEVLVKSGGGKVKYVIISLYNKGDDRQISVSELNKMADEMEAKLTAKLGSKPEEEDVEGVVNLNKKVWKWHDTAFSLEKSRSGATAEFLRVSVSSVRTERNGATAANKADLRSNVTYDKQTGDVYIPNVPMVDQGRKGYCACASAARIYQYYGLNVGQHEIAQMAGSTAQGTDPAEMIEALKKASSHLDSRVLVLYEYPKHMTSKNYDMKKWESGQREMMRDFNSYQQLAKKLKTPGLKVDGKEYGRLSKDHYVLYMGFIQSCHPDTFRQLMVDKSSFKRWKSKIREYIDQGIPVGWGLQLGMFKEANLPQVDGGHMRLIIGYNEKTDEIIYSDSWGAGHAKKSMDAGQAFCMSQCIIVLPPKN